MKTINRLAVGIAVALSVAACANRTGKTAIRQAVERQMAVYPRSTLRDLYKNFFQDRFGPGHIIADTTAAGDYLRMELESRDTFPGTVCERTGCRGNFYRVNLSVVKDGTVPYRTYFDAFVRSVNGIEPISVEEWAGEWRKIESVIEEMDLRLALYEEDKGEIAELLRSGKYVMHHSRGFVETYDPHYRIIEKTIFEKEILPLLKKDELK